MKGYLLRDHPYTAGKETFIDCNSSENNYGVVFEDDTDTGYFYAIQLDPETGGQQILDALHIYNIEDIPEEERAGVVKIIWSTDWLRCALIINSYCHAVFDFEHQGGYCRNEFPPPNSFWTKGSRTLTDEMIVDLFK
jgi:hypothetical protein